MKKFGSSWLAAAALVAGLGAVSSASANWTFGAASGTVADANPSGVSITSFTGAYAANGGTLVGGGAAIVAGNTYGISGFASGATWSTGASSSLAYYSGNGLGMSSDSLGSAAPNHALDNGPSTTMDANNYVNGVGNTEAVLLNFSSSVVLSSVGIGYKFGDADISVFRYTGGSAPSLTGVNATSVANMSSAGWQLVGNYGDLAVDTTTAYSPVNAGNLGSSWWLISAYNSSYGAATSGTVDQGNDFFKLYAVEGTKCTSTTAGVCGPGTSVPEPGSLALASLAMVGVFAGRRRLVWKQKSA